MVRDRGGQAMAEPHQGVPDPRELLEIARSVVRPAAELAVAMRDAGVGEVSTKTTDTDVVTAADRAVERQAVAALRRARPGDAVLGEEGSTVAATGSRVRWILDPIDGTVNYLYGLPLYAVSLAAEVDRVAVAGVVRNATSGEEWTAIRGRGAYPDGRRRAGPVPDRRRGARRVLREGPQSLGPRRGRPGGGRGRPAGHRARRSAAGTGPGDRGAAGAL